MTKILLKVKGEQEQRMIEEITVLQFKKGMKIFKSVLANLKENGQLSEIMEELAKADDELLSEQEKNAKFLGVIANSFDFLVEELPEQATELLAIASGLEVEIIDQQTMETFFDIFDAIVETNNLEQLITRAKKSLALTQTKWKMGKKTKARK